MLHPKDDCRVKGEAGGYDTCEPRLIGDNPSSMCLANDRRDIAAVDILAVDCVKMANEYDILYERVRARSMDRFDGC
jgi:hypothetical protein